jgi:hypothetical protein
LGWVCFFFKGKERRRKGGGGIWLHGAREGVVARKERGEASKKKENKNKRDKNY